MGFFVRRRTTLDLVIFNYNYNMEPRKRDETLIRQANVLRYLFISIYVRAYM